MDKRYLQKVGDTFYYSTEFQPPFAFVERIYGHGMLTQKQANNLEITGGKGSGKTGRMDEFEELMTAEEAAGGPGGGGRGFKRGAGGRVGNDFEDTGF